MAKPETKDQILDAAEDLFAEQGFAATSMRQITSLAQVNLAAVNYHFGSKEELAKAVLRRRIAPINSERGRRLDQLDDQATISEIVCAFIEPALQVQQASPETEPTSRAAGLCRLFGRISVEQPPFLREFVGEQFGELGNRFVAVLSKASPGIAAETLWWRMHFMIGALSHTLQNSHILEQASGGACDVTDHDTIMTRLTAFAIGGLSTTEAAR